MPRELTEPLRRDLIGLKVKVASSLCPSYKGIGGIVIDETKNILVLSTGEAVKRVPKKSSSFLIELEGRKPIKVEGWRLVGRPEDRLGR